MVGVVAAYSTAEVAPDQPAFNNNTICVKPSSFVHQNKIKMTTPDNTTPLLVSVLSREICTAIE
jgi:hypothetical protein